MSYIIAVCGKGGTGKTTFAALIMRWLLHAHKGKSILAVDADPNSNFDGALGVKSENNMVAIIDEIGRNPSVIPSGMTKDRFLEYQIQDSLVEGDGFDLLVMGRPEGPGCYCYANNLLRSMIIKLGKTYSYMVIDNEAGMEHLSRRTARKIDLLFMVSDYNLIGLRTVKRILELTKELELTVKDTRLVINRAPQGKVNHLKEEIDRLGIPLRGIIPEDKEITRVSLEGADILSISDDSKVVKAVDKILSNEEITYRSPKGDVSDKSLYGISKYTDTHRLRGK